MLGPIVPFNIRCVPGSRCQPEHINQRSVHRLSIVDSNGNVGQVRVPDDAYLHRRSAIPAPAYGILIALSLFARDKFAEFTGKFGTCFSRVVQYPSTILETNAPNSNGIPAPERLLPMQI